VTVDVTRDCTVLTPCDEGYFLIGQQPPFQFGVARYDNILWGDWYMIDYANDFAQGDTLVHVEAVNPADVIGRDTLNGTFYGRCALDWDKPWATPWFDLRETLPTTFATRFYQNDAFSGGTDLLVWRDSVLQLYLPDWAAYWYGSRYGDRDIDGFNCNIGPLWFPLSERQVVVFDEAENPETLCTISPCPEEDISFPFEAERVSIPSLDLTPQSGWLYMNLNQGTMLSQAWVTSVHSAEGRFSAGLPAIQLDNFCDNTSIVLGPTGPAYPASEWIYNWYTDEDCQGGVCEDAPANANREKVEKKLQKFTGGN
jgi:hypothetical protein